MCAYLKMCRWVKMVFRHKFKGSPSKGIEVVGGYLNTGKYNVFFTDCLTKIVKSSYLLSQQIGLFTEVYDEFGEEIYTHDLLEVKTKAGDFYCYGVVYFHQGCCYVTTINNEAVNLDNSEYVYKNLGNFYRLENKRYLTEFIKDFMIEVIE